MHLRVELDCFGEVFCTERFAAFCFKLYMLGENEREDTCSADIVMVAVSQNELEVGGWREAFEDRRKVEIKPATLENLGRIIYEFPKYGISSEGKGDEVLVDNVEVVYQDIIACFGRK